MVITHSAAEHDRLVEALLTDGTRVTALNELLFGGRGPVCLHNNNKKKMLPMTYIVSDRDVLQALQQMY